MASTSIDKLREDAAQTKPEPTPAEQRRAKLYGFVQSKDFRQGIAAAGRKLIDPDRMVRVLINAVRATPKLLECDADTVLGGMMTSAVLGLEPNTVEQLAFLIPYKKWVMDGGRWTSTLICNFQIGYRGFIALAYRSQEIKLLQASAVREGDQFDHCMGTENFLRFRKSLRNRGPLIGAFSHAIMSDGSQSAIVLPEEEVLKARAKSETYRSLVEKVATATSEKELAKAQAALAETPWVMWEDDMWTKTALRKHAKYLPLSPSDRFAAAARIDALSDAGAMDISAMADPAFASAVAQGEEDPPPPKHGGDDGLIEDQKGGQPEGKPAVLTDKPAGESVRPKVEREKTQQKRTAKDEGGGADDMRID